MIFMGSYFCFPVYCALSFGVLGQVWKSSILDHPIF